MTTWTTYRLGDAVMFNPPERLAKGTIAKKVAMEQLQPFTRAISGYELAAYSGGSKFRKGDTLMARITPCLENGKTAYVSLLDNDEVGFGSTEYIVLRNIEGVTDDKFLYYFVTNPWFRNIAIKSMVGSSGRQRVQQSLLECLKITLPPLAEQQRIAAILGALDDKIELNRRINANLEEQAKALFRELLYNYSSGKLYPLNKFANINPYRKITTGACARHIEMANLPTKGPFPANWTYKKFSGGAKFQNGDTLIARITPCLENGKAAYINCLDINEVAFGSTEYIVISAKEKYCPALFYFLVRDSTFIDYAVGHMNGSSGRQRISGNDIERYLVPEITQELSNKFAELAMPIMATIKNNSFENRKLAALRDALLPKLMRGEIMPG